MTITLTHEEAHGLLAALTELNRLSIGKDAICLPAEIDDAMEILEVRLSQCERCGEANPAEIHTCTPQEPVAYLVLFEGAGKLLEFTKGNYLHGAKVEHIPLYTAPPQREWQGLTDEDLLELVQKTPSFDETVAAVEAKLKEKNASDL
jgi:hypothetical protein